MILLTCANRTFSKIIHFLGPTAVWTEEVEPEIAQNILPHTNIRDPSDQFSSPIDNDPLHFNRDIDQFLA